MTRQEAREHIKGRMELYIHSTLDNFALHKALEALEQPEIIRCAGCHYYEDGHCDMHNMGVSPDDYCSYAVGKYNI